MAHSTDLEQQIHNHGGSAEGPAGSSSFATCNPIRGVAATLDPGQVRSNLGSLMPSCFNRLSPPRVHHVWPGENVFFCDGRVICGPDPRGLILTAMAVLLSEGIFLAYVVDGSTTHPTLISACSLILAATVTATLQLTAMRDPGIIPRNQVSPLGEAGTSTVRSSTTGRFAIVNGVETRLRFCRVCKIFRPSRSSHCAVCDNCVNRFDHHGTWISQCIRLRNYRLYLVFVCSALAFYTLIFPLTVRRISAKLDSVREGLFNELIYSPETYALAALSFLDICFFASLLAFNAFLVAKNKTSHEIHKGRHRSSPKYIRGDPAGKHQGVPVREAPAASSRFQSGGRARPRIDGE